MNAVCCPFVFWFWLCFLFWGVFFCLFVFAEFCFFLSSFLKIWKSNDEMIRHTIYGWHRKIFNFHNILSSPFCSLLRNWVWNGSWSCREKRQGYSCLPKSRQGRSSQRQDSAADREFKCRLQTSGHQCDVIGTKVRRRHQERGRTRGYPHQ